MAKKQRTERYGHQTRAVRTMTKAEVLSLIDTTPNIYFLVQIAAGSDAVSFPVSEFDARQAIEQECSIYAVEPKINAFLDVEDESLYIGIEE